ncbi:MAG: hypothetical protein KGJ89_01475 [Patescibacteria group bacterium]|nr:hypothetical protein [Patescibacteria group bacterium]MDE2015183.1 hypothetical protein [Patescibacteria group bacterium]MDE2226611.1 hypothetical protein [Patescibacteria group bacterium]
MEYIILLVGGGISLLDLIFNFLPRTIGLFVAGISLIALLHIVIKNAVEKGIRESKN